MSNLITAASTAPAHPGYFQPVSAMSRILEEASYLARCSDNKTAMRVRPREYAIRYPYMQVNRPGRVSWLVFDLDHANSLIWDEHGLPPPNFIVRNRNSGNSHIYYAIAPVCTTERAREKPILYMKAVYDSMAALLKADPDYHSGPVAKTPGHPWWITTELHNHVYDLGELAEELDLARPMPLWSKGPDMDAVSHSRHCTLFERVRFYAYSIVNAERADGYFESFYSRVLAQCHNDNRFRTRECYNDLPHSSVRATAKSIARWTWAHYRGSGDYHRGVMELDRSLPLEERQSLAARRTHAVRQNQTAHKIRGACRQLIAKGAQLTYTAIALTAGVSRQTVAKYKAVITEAQSPSVVPLRPKQTPLTPAAPQPAGPNNGAEPMKAGVKNAVYQVPAPTGVALLPPLPD
ncbi:replication initiation protein [Pseudomonas guariconensis]|uniref:replication initiation protein n=1 Tax=Pseudomonas guariconensis TaxID=1288410 RepID=UPI002D1F85CB|nr:replication initiation protein [Pseudomonas guariconensis]MEB3881584.1 replication initiation protein [Pseudomonas guariconensis]MEB3898018.1 replication initiation protein [Pseudomonas guariconensis]